MKKLQFFVLFFVLTCGHTAFAQGADGSGGGVPAISTTATSSSQQAATPVSGGALDSRPTSIAATSSTSSEPIPDLVISSEPSLSPAASSVPAEIPDPSPTTISIPPSMGGGGVGVPSVSNDAAMGGEDGTKSILPLIAIFVIFAGAGATALVFGAYSAQTKKNGTQKEDPCGALKKELETAQTAYDLALKNISLQEILITELKKEIDMAEQLLKEKVKEYAADVTHEIMEGAIEKETSEELSKAAAHASEAKSAYDSLVEKHKLANDLLEILKGRQQGLIDDVREKETAWKVCTQSAALAAGGGESGDALSVPAGESRIMYGTIVEQSLRDKNILDQFTIARTWNDGDWVLHAVEGPESKILEMSGFLSDGPWYAHFWRKENDEMLIIYKDKVFRVTRSDHSTWKEAVAHGRSLGIPDEQLDFALTENVR